MHPRGEGDGDVGLGYTRAGLPGAVMHVVIVTESEGTVFTTQVSDKLILLPARREREGTGLAALT